MSMKMLWLLALICRDFPCIICSKKSDLLLALKMLWWWFARHATGSKQEEPSRLACTAKRQRGNNPHAWFLPLGTGGNGGSKKIPDGGFLALGMLPSASKVGLKWVGWGAIHRSKLSLQILCFRPRSVQQINSYV